jgi:cytochrome c biogenesis protein CcmG, thiol:disulfide interchange protein DsbE
LSMLDPSTASAETPAAGSGSRGRGLLLAPALIFTAVVLMFGFALQKGDPSKLPSALIGKAAPPLDLPSLDGLAGKDGQPAAALTRDALATGQVSIVNFWASWCAPCVEEHPLLVRLAASRDLKLYGVNYKDQAANARRFLGRYGNPFAAVGVDANGRAAIEWGVYGMPETFVVDGRGVVTYKHVGPLTPASLATQLVPAIEAAKARR